MAEGAGEHAVPARWRGRRLPRIGALRRRGRARAPGQARPAAVPAKPLAAAARAGRISPRVFAGLVRAAEFGLVAGLGFLIAYLYVADFFRQYAAALLLAGLAAVTVFQALGLYNIAALAAAHRQLPRLLAGWTATVALLLAAVFLLKIAPDFSRAWLVLWYVGGAVALLAYRAAVAGITRRGLARGLLTRRAVVYGTGPACESLVAALESDPLSDIRICGVFDDRGIDRARRTIGGHPNLGNLEALIRTCRSSAVDILIVALPVSAETRVLQLINRLWVLPVDIRLAAQASKLRFRPRVYSFVGAVPLIDVIDKPIADWGVVIKWLFDKTVASLALLALAPVMALVALAVKLDSKGPVLFRQKRYGFNNELIEVFKFRSMYVDQSDADASRLVTKGDPRVTRVGRFIRKTSLDELPQLFNVMRGELSLVGPRPHALQAKAADRLYDEVVDGYFARHKVKPGITGWAQINGWRGETDTPEKIQKRVEHDLYYIDNWSVLFDLYILFKTPFALVASENAY
ncbi:MAG TPA: undecaprenyl-phosphate glucose phosphotransferase [Hyphomicrobiaceae bacterium]|nr:undecaprenyl-phosphate glucose phosphotransferase [Hyphomicrobiaceae bacterium]